VYALTSAARLAEETAKKQAAALRIAKEALMQQEVDDEEEEVLGFECYLAILKVTETGGAEGGGYRHRWGDDDDWEMVAGTAERECMLYNFLGLDEKAVTALGTMHIDVPDEDDEDEEESEFLPPYAFSGGIEWDDQQVEEASGNEGATMERWYVHTRHAQVANR